MAYTNVWYLARWPLIVVALWLNYWSITCAVTHPTPDLARPCLTSVTVRHRVKQLREPTMGVMGAESHKISSYSRIVSPILYWAALLLRRKKGKLRNR